MKTFNILAIIYVSVIVLILLVALFTRTAHAESRQICQEQGYVIAEEEYSVDEIGSAESIMLWYSQYKGALESKAAEVFNTYTENISALTAEDYANMDLLIQAK